MTDFNDIGISRQLDLPRLRKLLRVYLVKHFPWTDDICRFGNCFLLPGTMLFFASFLYLQIVQMRAFVRKVPASRLALDIYTVARCGFGEMRRNMRECGIAQCRQLRVDRNWRHLDVWRAAGCKKITFKGK